MGLTQSLAQYALDNRDFDRLPSELVTVGKEMMLNAAAVALAAAAQPDGQRITQFIQEMAGNGKCTIIGRGLRSSPVYAALANGLMTHLLDFDDVIISTGVHPSCTSFPVVMALGEMQGSSGRDVLTAFLLGCQITSKLARCLKPKTDATEPAAASGGWHADGVAGTIGAAVAAGLLMNLDPEQMQNAIGIAAGQSSGVTANEYTPARALQCGQAAMNGVMAAHLSQQGLVGSSEALESAGGWSRLFCQGNLDIDQLENALNQSWDVLDPGITLKLYPCNVASHTAIDAALQLVQLHRMEPQQISRVHVSITPAAMAGLPFPTPQNGWEARGCASYIVAVALIHGHPLIDFFSDQAATDPAVRGLMDRISVEATEPTSPLAPFPSTVTVELSDGGRIQHTTEVARGQPQMPLEQDDLNAKFLYCTRYILPPDHIEEAIDSFRNLENIENVTGMASVLGG